ncbi:hypothetical protein G8764_13705 [Pseudomaricurvus alcaniphilus]|uniref:hypothetical protein n=1 Tax=Pseudomaricurvus alcaniphilus TaxID=1166482 RepID=UPI00140C52B2|nr:hypothetical protein [Pseudomaricurvus alcaniphilus]NHN38358.1 hypothetical protein [Pseudomaricurvus alcaniphilus]
MPLAHSRPLSPAPQRASIAPWQQLLALLLCVVLNGVTLSSAHTSGAAPQAQTLGERLSLASGYDHLRTALTGQKQDPGADNSSEPSSPDALGAAPQLPVALVATSPLQALPTAATLLARHYRLPPARAPPLA